MVKSSIKQLQPGASLGVVGGGQLGRYFVLIARQLGYHVWVLDPDANAPAMQIASVAVVANYDDESALRRLGDHCDAVTIEFENVPASSLELLESITQVAPKAQSVQLSQDRLQEKRQARACGLQPVPHANIESIDDIDIALASVKLPAILKTNRLGYDGKGQISCHSAEEVVAAFNSVGSVPCVLEQKIALAAEMSVVLARSFAGEIAVFPVAENVHIDGILHSSSVPASQAESLQAKAIEQGKSLAGSMQHAGVLAIEFFIDKQGELYFNEMAPRPHNSGHYTLDATMCSQFEQQLRVLCDLPLADTSLLSPVVMFNLLGDLWNHASPDFSMLFAEPGCMLHLYGKSEARPGRKMGHVNCLSLSAEHSLSVAQRLFSGLQNAG